MENIERLKEIWMGVYNPNTNTKEVIERYFHPKFSQSINGIRMNLRNYIKHVVAQKATMTIEEIEYGHSLEDKETLFAIYSPKGKLINGAPLVGEVIAYFVFKDNQIFSIEGQVRILEGDLSDVDMKKS